LIEADELTWDTNDHVYRVKEVETGKQKVGIYRLSFLVEEPTVGSLQKKKAIALPSDRVNPR
jgi:hypothetical protein